MQKPKLLSTGYYHIKLPGFFIQFPKGFDDEKIDEYVCILQHQESYREEFLHTANAWWEQWKNG